MGGNRMNELINSIAGWGTIIVVGFFVLLFVRMALAKKECRTCVNWDKPWAETEQCLSCKYNYPPLQRPMRLKSHYKKNVKNNPK
jgi:hypothetical protein